LLLYEQNIQNLISFFTNGVDDLGGMGGSAKTPPSSCFRENIDLGKDEVWRTKIVEESTFSRKQDEGDIFALHKCSQSIPRIKLPLYRPYREKKEKILSENDLLSGPPLRKMAFLTKI
jgi:hypothetical protein